MADMNKPLLEVKNLKTFFKTRNGIVKAVNDVSYSIYPGKTLGIVGESGSGKSVSAMSVLRLLDANAVFGLFFLFLNSLNFILNHSSISIPSMHHRNFLFSCGFLMQYCTRVKLPPPIKIY